MIVCHLGLKTPKSFALKGLPEGDPPSKICPNHSILENFVLFGTATKKLILWAIFGQSDLTVSTWTQAQNGPKWDQKWSFERQNDKTPVPAEARTLSSGPFGLQCSCLQI